MDELPKGAKVLEIGPGLGAISFPLLELGASITAVELDKGLALALSKAPETQGKDFKVINQDILKLDIKSHLGEDSYLIAGNLPYNISTPVLFWFLENFPLSKGIFMLQKDLVERILAKPGTKEYGRLTVGLKPFFTLKSPFDVGSHAFQPRPKVKSSILLLTPRPDRPSIAPKEFGAFTALCFHSRRKTLMNNLIGSFERNHAKTILLSLGIKPEIRPEELEPNDFVKMFEAFRGKS
jgi:16S rRNA (adenine1518-N6/adenine1519-N6)-dimethyltransferase